LKILVSEKKNGSCYYRPPNIEIDRSWLRKFRDETHRNTNKETNTH